MLPIAAATLGIMIGAGLFGLRDTHAVVPPSDSEQPTASTSAVNPSSLSVAEQLSSAFAAAAAKATPSVVTVYTETTVQAPKDAFGSDDGSRSPYDQFFGDDFFRKFFETPEPHGNMKRAGLGSGVVLDKNGIILTNNHVVDDADNIKVRLIDGREFVAKVKGRDPQTDLAVLTIDAKGLQSIQMGDSDKARVGDWVLAVGSPLNPQLEHSVTSGIISAKGRSAVGLSQYEDYIQTDAAINPGNSGGALVDLEGNLIGINTAIASQNGGFSGIGFAIPANLAGKIADDILQHGKVVRGWLGVSIQNISPEMAKALDLDTNKGAIVTSVDDDSPAAKAGMKTEDVIVKIDGRPIDNVTELATRVAGSSPGTTISVEAVRQGKTKDFKVTLGELTAKNEQLARGQETHSNLGLVVANFTPELAQKYGIAKNEHGVIVSNVEPDGIAAQIGIREGDLIVEVNRQEVRSAREFDSEMRKVKSGDEAMFYLRRGDEKFFVALTVPEQMVP
jgi:serine protease Do